MIKLSKKWVFSFIGSFFITFVLGFLIWSFFVIPDISSHFFTASLSNSNVINLPEESEQIEPVVEVLEDVETQDIVVQPEDSLQDQLDDIQEKLDIISQQVQLLIEEQNPKEEKIEVEEEIIEEENKEEEELKEDDLIDEEKNGETSVCTGQININTALAEDLEKIIYVGPATAQKIILARPFYSLNDLLKVSGIGEKTLQKIIEQGCAYVEPGLVPPVIGGGGGGNVTTYPKILISEVQIAGAGDEKQEFVELYNPNNQDVYLTGWYLRKKTSGGNVSYFDKKSLLTGQKISANGYFLIAREEYFNSISDVSVDSALSDNSSLTFYNPDDGVSDEANWSSIANGLSWCFDFELCSPTPKAQNTVFVPPDTIAPVIALIGAHEVTINVGDTYSDEGAIASDNVDGDITEGIIIVNPVNADVAGDYTITYNISDTAGNHAAEVRREVHIVAVPTLSSDATVISAVYAVSSLSNATGTITNIPSGTSKTDFETNLTKNQLNQIWDDSGITDPIATGNTLAVTAQDGITTATYTITVNPVIILPIITSYTINGLAQSFSFNPNANHNIPIVIIASEPVKWISAKIYKITDSSVYKNKNPSGDETITGTMSWDGILTKPTIDSISDGIYAIKVHIVDMAGNDVTGLILSPYTITVDTIAPVITPKGDSTINLTVGSEYIELGAIADDGSIVNVEGLVDTTVVGSYNVIYNAIDLAGNEAVPVVRTITVTAIVAEDGGA